MNKYLKCVGVFLVAMTLVFGLTACLRSETPTPVVEVETFALAPRPLVPYGVHSYNEVEADRWVILVGLTDSAGYPHAAENTLVLKSLLYNSDLSAAEEWEWKVGVAVTSTVDGVGIEWLTGGSLSSTDEVWGHWDVPEHGLSLRVSSESLMFFQSQDIETTTSITSATVVSSTKDCLTGTVAAGDLILLLDEIAGSATLTMTMDAFYEAE